jgi:hypothetical protein
VKDPVNSRVCLMIIKKFHLQWSYICYYKSSTVWIKLAAHAGRPIVIHFSTFGFWFLYVYYQKYTYLFLFTRLCASKLQHGSTPKRGKYFKNVEENKDKLWINKIQVERFFLKLIDVSSPHMLMSIRFVFNVLI